eukprot:SAG31_NODE_2140_length_6350_cov_2.239962_2_plen_47_part_00
MRWDREQHSRRVAAILLLIATQLAFELVKEKVTEGAFVEHVIEGEP